MEFRILGPIEVSSGGQPLQLGGGRQRGLLAYLLLHANTVVSADRLLDELWTEPPAGGVTVLQTHISRLRKSLGDRIATSGRGYQLHVEPGELDLERFRGLLAEAGATADPSARSGLLREADGLWRGDALAGLDVPFAAAEAAALEELRLGALEDRLAADLDRGLDGELIAELSALVARHPLRERLRGQLILSLYRADRQADALEAYRQTRQMLDEELGLEPSPALRELERAILRHDPALAPPTSAAKAAPSVETAPRRLRGVVIAVVALTAVGAIATVAALMSGSGSPRTLAAPKVGVGAPHAKAPRRRVNARRRAHPAVSHVAPVVVEPRVHAVATRSKPATELTATTAATTSKPATKAPVAATKPTTTKPATTTTPTSEPVRIADDFSSDAIDSLTWSTWTGGTGATSTQQSGQLVFSIPADAGFESRWNSVGVNYGTKCEFPGDFDAQIDYTLLTWPHNEGASVSLTAFQTGPVDEISRSTSSGHGDYYTAWPGGGSAPLADRSGTLRIARSNGVVRTYILHNGQWRTLGAQTIAGEIWVGMTLGASSSDWQQSDVSAAFDNFVVTAPDADCPTGSDPRGP